MTSDTSIDVREVIFINPDAESGYDGLPADCQRASAKWRTVR